MEASYTSAPSPPKKKLFGKEIKIIGYTSTLVKCPFTEWQSNEILGKIKCLLDLIQTFRQKSFTLENNNVTKLLA
jgi:hypothetical protein